MNKKIEQIGLGLWTWNLVSEFKETLCDKLILSSKFVFMNVLKMYNNI